MNIKEKTTVYDFLDNKLFVEANKDKKLSNEDKVAIIIRSVKSSLNEKFKILEKIKEYSSKELADNIQEWIDVKKQMVEYVRNLRKDGIVFLVMDNPKLYRTKIFNTLNEINFEYLFFTGTDVSIEQVSSGLPIGRITIRKDRRNYVEDPNNNLYEVIANVSLNTKTILEDAPKLSNRALYNHIVELNHPFKPFDFVDAPGFNDFYRFFVVADENDKFVKQVMEDPEKGPKPMRGDWLKLNVPNYYLETNPCFGNGVKQGVVTQSIVHRYFMCNLNDIKLYSPEEMKVEDVNYINEIKSQLSDRFEDINL